MIILILFYSACLAIFAFAVIGQVITFKSWKYTGLAIYFFASIGVGFGLPIYFKQSTIAGALYWVIIFIVPPAIIVTIADYIKKLRNK